MRSPTDRRSAWSPCATTSRGCAPPSSRRPPGSGRSSSGGGPRRLLAAQGQAAEWTRVLVTRETCLHGDAGRRNAAVLLHRSAGGSEGARPPLHGWGHQGWEALCRSLN
uniref:Uncharacterized protein n=1 Tax=Arundo donax TaxID=35708 RepID=A0A0A9E1Q5_ARUDO